jgi:glucose-6-phosphate dehydrogenase assembly protein OpcA
MATEAPDQFFAQGIPVEIGKIQRELKKLWQNSDRTATRASRLNLVIYSAAEHSIRANTALVEKIARQHALRAILIAAKPQKAGENNVRAWINAHCQISKSGAKQRCSEQICFQLEGSARDLGLIPNIVLSHLDSDLPMYLWWQGDFPAEPEEKLMSWVDCLLFDSADWSNPAEQIAIVEKMAAGAGLEHALGDLNWGRLSSLRLAIAQFFDAPAARPLLNALESVEITHAPGSRLTATLLVGWLAAQLGWEAQAVASDGFTVRNAAGKAVSVKFTEAAGPHISRVLLKAAGGAEFVVSRETGLEYYSALAHLSGEERDQRQMLPVGADEKHELVIEELSYGGEHRCYRKALRFVAASQGLTNGK